MIQMQRKEFMQNRISLALPAITLAVIIFWHHSVTKSPELGFLIGKPSDIVLSAPDILANKDTVSAFFWTSSAAYFGLILGTLVGSTLALISSLSSIVSSVANPYMKCVASLPLLALAPLFTFWCGIDWPAKVTLSGFACTFLAFEQALYGTKQAREMLPYSLQQSTRLQWFPLVRYVLLPGAHLQIKRGIHLNISTSLTAVIMGEFIASERGLGHILLQSLGIYKLSEAWVVLLLIVLSHRLITGVTMNGPRLIARFGNSCRLLES
jgi:ABC-type nitrate/sulfonate/bicarbonate transport system permease component